METKQTIKKERKKIRKSLALFVLGYLLFSLILIAGCILVGIGYKNFVVYNNLLQYWINQGGGTLNTFSSHLVEYNNLATTNEWTQANITLFAPGVTLLIVGIISIIILVIFNIKKPKENQI